MKIKCRICNNYKQCSSKYYYIKSSHYNSIVNLNKNYICHGCLSIVKNYLSKTKKLKFGIKKIIKKYSSFNMSINENRQNFLSEIKQIMSKNFLESYQFIIYNNNIVGIKINNIPFINNMEIKL